MAGTEDQGQNWNWLLVLPLGMFLTGALGHSLKASAKAGIEGAKWEGRKKRWGCHPWLSRQPLPLASDVHQIHTGSRTATDEAYDWGCFWFAFLSVCWQLGSWRLRAKWGLWSSKCLGHEALSLSVCVVFSLRAGTRSYSFLDLSQSQCVIDPLWTFLKE